MVTKDETKTVEQLGNDWPKIKPIIDQCLEWYEEDHLALYTIFKSSCGSPGIVHFFGNLHSFLVNVLLDDSCFKVVLNDEDEPFLEWASDDDEDSCSDEKEILKVFDWYKEDDLKRNRLEAEKIKLLNELADRIEKDRIHSDDSNAWNPDCRASKTK